MRRTWRFGRPDTVVAVSVGKAHPLLLPQARVITLADVYRLLGRQTADDAICNGWLKPCCLKNVPRGPQRRLYALADINRVEDRLLSGQYPGQTQP